MANEKKFITLDNMRRFMSYVDKVLILLQNDYHTIIDNLKSQFEAKSPVWDGKYNKPVSGIPKSDLTVEVQTSLEKADNAASKSSIQDLEERVSVIESWTTSMTVENLLAQIANITTSITIGGVEIIPDGDGIKIKGKVTADNFYVSQNQETN